VAYVPVLAVRLDEEAVWGSSDESLAAAMLDSSCPIDAVVVTSRHGARAITEAFSCHPPVQELVRSLAAESRVFAVGPATAAGLPEGIAAAGTESGTAASLAGQIAGRLAGRSGRVVYACGRKRRPDLEAGLAEAGVAVKAVEVYGSSACSPSEVSESWKAASAGAGVGPVRLVFFSPRGLAAAAAVAGVRDAIAGGCRVIAIGPTTAEAARSLLEGAEIVAAATPTPEGVIDACDAPAAGHG